MFRLQYNEVFYYIISVLKGAYKKKRGKLTFYTGR